MMQGAQVDVFGVGERLITSSSSPVFGGVYKLVAVEEPTSGEIIPKIKVSENTSKITNPHFKNFTVIMTTRAARLLPTNFACTTK